MAKQRVLDRWVESDLLEQFALAEKIPQRSGFLREMCELAVMRANADTLVSPTGLLFLVAPEGCMCQQK